MADVLIAGGGVAGASAAILLGRAGLTVELFERSRMPREKPCGEGLMPAGVRALERWGLAEAIGGAPFHGVRYLAAGAVAEGRFPPIDGRPAVGRGQRRLHLDRVLFEAAAATPGVTARESVAVERPIVEQGRIVGLVVAPVSAARSSDRQLGVGLGGSAPAPPGGKSEIGDETMAARSLGEERRARLVVAADGVRSPLRRQLGLEGAAPRRARVGVRTHFRLHPGQPFVPWVEVYVGAGYELYVTPLPDGELLVAGLAEAEAVRGGAEPVFARWLSEQPALAARLAGAERLTPLQGRAPLAAAARAGVVPGCVLLGDAAGYVDPLTGGGMTQAMLSAELLADHAERLLTGDPAAFRAFDREREALLRDYRVLTQLVLALARYPAVARATVRLLGATPRLFAHLIGVAGGARPLLPFRAG